MTKRIWCQSPRTSECLFYFACWDSPCYNLNSFLCFPVLNVFHDFALMQLRFLFWTLAASYCSKSDSRKQIIAGKPSVGNQGFESQPDCMLLDSVCSFSFVVLVLSFYWNLYTFHDLSIWK